VDLNIYDSQGNVARQVTAQDAVFGVPFARGAVHQAYVRQLANRRQGDHNTKGRGDVKGSTRKLFRQKGTGRARQGSVRAPHRRGGGIAHGPHPRDYHQDIPKKMRRLAIKSVLSAKARDGELFVLESLEFAAPRTKDMVALLTALGLSASTLVLTTGDSRNVMLSARNIPWVRTLPANLTNVADLIHHRNVVLSAAALAEIERIWGERGTDAAAAGREEAGNASV
jgi:large subunit ribosomal protein L4